MVWLKAIIEILFFFLIFYYLIRSLKGTQGEGVIIGYVLLFVLLFAVLLALARYFSLRVVEFFVNNFLSVYIFAIVVVFQQEARNGLIRLGQLLFDRLLESERRNEREILEAVTILAENKIGALIAIKRNVGLKNYLEKGIRLDAKVSKELLCSIFWPGSPLHDGGVIIQENKIAAASCIFPLSERDLSSYLGTRHRAALGLADLTDALVIAVSEERGEISICAEGKMQQNISPKDLEQILRDTFLRTEESFPKKQKLKTLS